MKSIIEKVKKGDKTGVQRDVDMFNIDPKQIFYDTYKQTPIFYCTLIKDESIAVEMLNYFISVGVDAGYRDTLKQTPLYYAAREGQNIMVQILCDNGCNPNNQDEYGQSPVYYACRDNKAETVKYLINKGANLN